MIEILLIESYYTPGVASKARRPAQNEIWMSSQTKRATGWIPPPPVALNSFILRAYQAGSDTVTPITIIMPTTGSKGRMLTDKELPLSDTAFVLSAESFTYLSLSYKLMKCKMDFT